MFGVRCALANFNLFFVFCENLFILLIILGHCEKASFIKGAIIVISKRAELKENSDIKSYCKIADRDSDERGRNFLKINCSQVPGPIRKLNVEIDNYLKLTSGHYIAPTEYCVLTGNPNYGKLCPSHSDPLWRKCCPENEVLDATSFTCRPSQIKYRPKFKNSATPQSFTVLKTKSNSTYKRVLQCGSGFVPKVYSSLPCLPESLGSFQLASNGTPMYQASTGVFLRKTQLKSVEQDSYCVDGLVDFSSRFPLCNNHGKGSKNYENGYNRMEDHHREDGGAKCQNEMGEVLLVCMEEQDTISNENGDEKGVPKAYFFAALWLSTCPLLVSAAVVNSCVIQRNVHGWILTSYLLSMFLVNINSVILILDVTQSSSPTTNKSASLDGGCGILDFTMKYIYMSTLCWMTSMNFGLWRTFSSNVPQVVAPQRFLLSALFSLGFPIFAVSISYYMGSLPDDNAATSIQSRTCEKGTCPLYSHKTVPYYYGPIIILVLCNLAAFLKTSTTIASLRRQAEAVLHKQAKDHLESFTLFAKLFLLTGSIWVIRVFLLILQIQGLYVTWYGVALEAVFSIPEVVFPMIIFHHPEFIKWTWRKSPMISHLLVKCNPFCRKELIFKEGNSLELQSGNQMDSAVHDHHRVKQGEHEDSSPCKTETTSGAITTTALVVGRTITITTFTTIPKSRREST